MLNTRCILVENETRVGVYELAQFCGSTKRQWMNHIGHGRCICAMATKCTPTRHSGTEHADIDRVYGTIAGQSRHPLAGYEGMLFESYSACLQPYLAFRGARANS